MRMQRWLAIGASAFALILGGARTVAAQGLTTGAVGGTVADATGKPLENVQVEIVNSSSGYKAGIITRSNGRYFVQGLEVGAYRVSVRMLGYAPQARNDVIVSLNLTTRVDFTLTQAAATLATVKVEVTASGVDFSPTKQGIGTTIGDSSLRRIGTLQRDFTDLVKLTPQVSTVSGQGPSAGGAYNRLNNFQIDGSNQNDRFNLGASGGQPGGATSGRLISLDAVKEVQIMLSPTDVRYGNFAGMLVNAVTRSGTNTFQGGGAYLLRTPYMAANIDAIRQSGFRLKDYGFNVGGPIIKNKLHFFIAPEFQHRTDPTTGVQVDPTANTVGTSTTKISLDSIKAIQNALGSKFDVGSPGAFSRGNPLTNLMGRIDWSINDLNRLTFRVLDNTAEQVELSRSITSLSTSGAGTQTTGLRLTSNSFTRRNKNKSYTAQLFSNLNNGMANELLFGYNFVRDYRIVPVNAPEISIGVTPNGATTANAAITVGSERFSPGNDLKQKIYEVSDNFTIPLGEHTATFGGRYEHTYIYNYFLSGAAYGAYYFNNIAALQAGTPSSYAFSYANGGPIQAEFSGSQMTGYAQDLWNVTRNLSVTYGVRVDVPMFADAPKQNDLITQKAASLRTDYKIKTQYMWSPRIGFNWDVSGDQTTQMRGNVGIYTGQTPYILIGNAYGNTGLGGVTITCDGKTTATQVPAFTTDLSQLPKSCLGAPSPTPGAAGTAGINVNDPNFKYPQNITVSAGADHRLPGGFVATVEALYRKEINGLYVRDLNLKGPRLVNGVPYTDVNGRILYADTISATGSVTNTGQKLISTTLGSNNVTFSEGAIQLTNATAGYNYTVSGQLRKRFSRAFEATAAYTYNRSKDVQSLTSDRAISNWRNARQFSGLEYAPGEATTSNFERPHRIVMYGSYTAPWRKNQTDVSFYFEGISGSPIVYVTNADINGDGIAGNDPIYVPKNASDPNEVRIGTGANATFALNATAAAAFDKFITMQPCLNRQRGHIMARNSCNGPFQKRMDVSVRQTLPEVSGQRLTAQLDIFNFANLLNKAWGRTYFPIASSFNNQSVLLTAGKTAGPLNTSLWNYNLLTSVQNGVTNFNSPFTVSPNSASNNYQIQITMRYAF